MFAALAEAETHRLAATESAESLLSLFAGKEATRPQAAESSPYIRRIVDEEQAAALAVGEAARRPRTATDHVDRLNNSEFLLFGLVLLVLMLEGLFVINPAVLRIQRFMTTSGSRTPTYRPTPRNWSGATVNFRTLHRWRPMTFRSHCGRSRPSATG